MSILYFHAADNKASGAAVTATPEDSTYPAANLVDENPGTPSKLSATSGSWVIDLAQATRVDAVAFWKHNFDPALTVQIQMHASDVWTAPTLSTTITIPALPEDAYPFCPWVDLRSVAGYAVSGFRYLRINVPSANSVNCALGDVFLGSVAKTLSHLQRPGEIEEDHPITEHALGPGRSLVYDEGMRIRTLRCQGLAAATETAALRSWHRACHGRARPGLLIPDTSVNDAWFGRFPAGSGLLIKGHGAQLSSFQFVWQEIGAGLKL